MSDIEAGCRDIVIGGFCEKNIGKIVTVGKFLGKVDWAGGNDHWETDILMYGSLEGNGYSNRGRNLQRIDDHDTENILESEKELVTTH